MHYLQQNWQQTRWKKTSYLFCLLLCVFFFFFLHGCIATVAPSRVYKLLPLLRCLSAGGSESCVYAGFTRCWFSRWTDDRLSQQLRRQIHSPTLSSLPPRFFSPRALFTYICPRLAFSTYLHHINVLTFLSFLLVSAWHISMEGSAETKTLSSFCVWISIMILQDYKLINYYFKTTAKQKVQANAIECCTIRSRVIVRAVNKLHCSVFLERSHLLQLL